MSEHFSQIILISLATERTVEILWDLSEWVLTCGGPSNQKAKQDDGSNSYIALQDDWDKSNDKSAPAPKPPPKGPWKKFFTLLLALFFAGVYSLAYFSSQNESSPFVCFEKQSYNGTVPDGGAVATNSVGCYEVWWIALVAAFLAPFSHQLFNTFFKVQQSSHLRQ